MANLTVRDIPEKDYAELQQDAKQNRRSINAEVLSLLAGKAQMNRHRRHASKSMKRIDKLWKGIGQSYPNQPDSVDLIREDRDSR
jgi:plasmid stability protein